MKPNCKRSASPLFYFTEPVDKETAANVKSYSAKHWSYNYYGNYGDKQQNLADLTIAKAVVAADGKSVDLTIPGRLPGYINEVRLNGLRGAEGNSLLHSDRVLYTQ